MIRAVLLILIIFIFHSCAITNESISSSSYLKVAYEYFSPKKIITISRNEYDEIAYSFAQIKFKGKSATSIIILSKYQDGIYRYVAEDGSIFLVNNLLPTESQGFIKDFKWRYTSCDDGFNKETINIDFRCNGLVSFSNPDLNFAEFLLNTSFLGATEIPFLGDDIRVLEFEHRIYIPSIKWSSTNHLYVNNGRLIKFIGKLHPLLDELEIVFYYK